MDGHEGRDALEFVRKNLFRQIADELMEDPEDIPQTIRAIFQNVDSEYCETKALRVKELIGYNKSCFHSNTSQTAVPQNTKVGSGCVLSLLCIYKNQIVIAGLGDCGIVCSSAGRSCYYPIRHNPYIETERQRILVRECTWICNF